MDAEKYMLHCLDLAQKASDEDEVPIGAAVVDPESGEIVSEAYNLSEHKLDATAHAETLAIRRACEKLGVNRLRGLDLYVTLEPCTMCAAAISMARIKTLYFGAYDPKGGAVVNGREVVVLLRDRGDRDGMGHLGRGGDGEVGGVGEHAAEQRDGDRRHVP